MEDENVRPLGVIATPAEEHTIYEFFELFKIPWEFYSPGGKYQVVISCGEVKLADISASVLIAYADEEIPCDVELNVQVQTGEKQPVFTYGKNRLPIYGAGVTFALKGSKFSQFIAFVDRSSGQVAVRVGYDLFREVHFLLTSGQPIANSGIPTLDLHIAILRDLILYCGIPLIEIPPVPVGYSFITCLTHDVDHAALHRHKFDHTMFGFIYRSTVGSTINAVRGRMTTEELLTNWVAAAKLPLMYMGLVKDYWCDFDRYSEIEEGKPSTFFFIPFERYAGYALDGQPPKARATRYDISHVAQTLRKLMGAGCEIGLHGIDAWVSCAKGTEEADRIAEYSGTYPMGVRMHWLFWNKDSPSVLERSGFSYDSTVGYNETVGYRAGTSQAFQPLPVSRILELPLLVMDTAMFSTDFLNLSRKDAWDLITPILDNSVLHGGAFTVNWHDRSIAPERLWGDFYISLLDQLEVRHSWFSTGMQAVSWFRKRRAAVFKKIEWRDGRLSASVSSPGEDRLPNLRLRFHRPWNSRESGTRNFPLPANYSDTNFSGHIEIHLPN